MSVTRRHKELKVRKPMDGAARSTLMDQEDKAENYFKSIKEVYSMVERKNNSSVGVDSTQRN